jgi:signal transduction histidine kinase
MAALPGRWGTKCSEGNVAGRDLEQTRDLELALVRLRWFFAVFGIVQLAFALRDGAENPDFILPLGVSLVAGLLAGNIAIRSAASQIKREDHLRILGGLAFALDSVVLLGLIWMSTSSPGDPVWVIGYLLPLEGAARYGVPGAIAASLVFGVAELGREAYLADRFLRHDFDRPALFFRAGMAIAVAVVAGSFARSALRETRRARERVAAAEESAERADTSAKREAEARSEVLALHAALLANVNETDLAAGLQTMVDAIGRELGSDGLGVLLCADGLAGEPILVATGVHGDPGYLRGDRVSGMHDPIGVAVEEARPKLRGEEAVVPLRVRGEVIGVIHERSRSGPLDRERFLLLGRLADQIALIVQSARLGARQEETLQRLRELDEMKSDFIAITSHELRTPLSAVRGFVDMLRRRGEDLAPEETEEFLGIIALQTDRLIRLVEDLLVVTRIEAGKLALDPGEVRTEAVLDQLVHGLGEDGARVRMRLGTDAPEVLVVDSQRLLQVLTNLLQNALKYSPEGAPVDVLASSGAEGTVTFAVADRGPGIETAEVERIFDRFHQTEAARTRTAEGFGLGLYITRQLVEAMGGWIDVVSEVGVGSTFSVTIPVARGLLAPARPPAAARSD